MLLQSNKKRLEPDEQCHSRTMMHCGADKAVLKMKGHHVPFRKMIKTKRYVRWTGGEKSLKKHTQVRKKLPKSSLLEGWWFSF